MANPSSIAPDFTLPDAFGESFTLSAQRPKNVVLYFYPKDDTPGCTKEALEFTALADQFEAQNTMVVGISKDTVKKHEKFKTKYDLNVVLVSDAEGEVCESFGTWVEKKMYGKTYMGIERSTFLIDGTGTIVTEWRKVKVPGHVDAVLEAVTSLNG